MSDQALVECQDVNKTYPGGFVAVDGLNLVLHEGEFVGLLGPSGCGKSTALRLVAALAEPTSGAVRRTWQDSAAAAGAGAPLGCVFQDPTLMPWTSVWNNVYLPLRLQGVGRAAARPTVDAALQRVELDRFANAYPRELSGGMKMRAAVARALVTEPRLLLLDEPFAALDEISRSRLNDDLLADWRSRRWCGLFVTHSVFESVYLSTRVLVMSPRPGRVVEEIVIDLPIERSAETRLSMRYLELCREVSAALQRAATHRAEALHG